MSSNQYGAYLLELLEDKDSTAYGGDA
jgi:hypothetical protein